MKDLNKVLLLKKVENSLAKGEIAHFEQFLCLPHCLKKLSAADGFASGKGAFGLETAHFL